MKLLRPTLAPLGLTAVLAACQAALPPPAAPGASAPTFGRPTPRHGPKVLWTTLAGEPETLDPARCSESLGGEVLDQLFAGLVQLGGPNGDTVLPDLAERWSQSADGLAWRFWLRRSGWSDGTQVSAEDFVAGLTRALAPATASRSAHLLFAVRGAQAFAEGRGPSDGVGVRSEGERVLVVELERPVPYFLQLCAHTVVRPVPRHLLARLRSRGEDPQRWSRPELLVANGAYALQRWRFKRDVVLTKNPHYWDAGQVAIDRVQIAIVESADAAVKLYRAGEIDLASGPLPSSYAQALRHTADFVQQDELNSAFYWLNVRRPPLDDVRVRRALSLSIDRQALARDVLHGLVQPSATLVPDGLAGYRAPPAPSFDPERARALLHEAGYGAGGKPLGPLRLVYNTAETNGQVAEAIQAMWQQHLGVQAVLETQEWRVYLTSLQQGDFDVARMGWVGDFADPDNFLTSVLGASGGNNLSGWQDDEFEALLAQAANARAAAPRLAVLRRAEAVALAAQPLLPLFVAGRTALVKPYLHGYGHSPLGRHPYKNMRVLAVGPP